MEVHITLCSWPLSLETKDSSCHIQCGPGKNIICPLHLSRPFSLSYVLLRLITTKCHTSFLLMSLTAYRKALQVRR